MCHNPYHGDSVANHPGDSVAIQELLKMPWFNNVSVGEVVKIRVRPTDVLTILDVLDYARVPREKMSIAMTVSRFVAICAEQWRSAGVLPERSGGEYNEMLEPYRGRQGQRSRVLTAHGINRDDVLAEIHDQPRVPSIPMKLKGKFSEREYDEMRREIAEDIARAERGEAPDYGDVSVGYLAGHHRASPKRLASTGNNTTPTAVRKSRYDGQIAELEQKRQIDPNNWDDSRERELKRLKALRAQRRA